VLCAPDAAIADMLLRSVAACGAAHLMLDISWGNRPAMMASVA